MAIDVYREWLKIAEPARPPDYYTLLGLVRFEDDRAAIQRNYRERSSLVRRFATGKYSKESQDLLDELARAMLTLTDPGRKTEYDRKLGRKTKRPPLEKRPMGQILVDDGLISKEQLREAEALAEELGLDLRQALVQKQIISWEESTRALAQQHNLPFFDLDDPQIPQALLEKVPADIATRDQLVPLLVDEGNLLVAVTYPFNLETLEVLRFRAGMPVRPVMCAPPAIRELVEKHYRETRAEPAAEPAEPESPAAEPLSLAGWLWRNVKWIGVMSALAGAAIGFITPFEMLGALTGAVAALAVLAVLLFTLK